MNTKAYFGKFGGQFVPETAMFALEELEEAYNTIAMTKEFRDELDYLLREYAGRPSPLYYAKRLSEHYGHDIYLKREDLNHTGAHKINNALAQALLAKKMGKKKVIAETGADKHLWKRLCLQQWRTVCHQHAVGHRDAPIGCSCLPR